MDEDGLPKATSAINQGVEVDKEDLEKDVSLKPCPHLYQISVSVSRLDTRS
jgi:hypothetical protein